MSFLKNVEHFFNRQYEDLPWYKTAIRRVDTLYGIVLVGHFDVESQTYDWEIYCVYNDNVGAGTFSLCSVREFDSWEKAIAAFNALTDNDG